MNDYFVQVDDSVVARGVTMLVAKNAAKKAIDGGAETCNVGIGKRKWMKGEWRYTLLPASIWLA